MTGRDTFLAVAGARIAVAREQPCLLSIGAYCEWPYIASQALAKSS